jgi:hypothetical protein
MLEDESIPVDSESVAADSESAVELSRLTPQELDEYEAVLSDE